MVAPLLRPPGRTKARRQGALRGMAGLHNGSPTRPRAACWKAILVSPSGAVGLFVYAIIAASQLKMQQRLESEAPERLQLRTLGYPWLTWVTLVLTLGVVASILFVDADARSQPYLRLISLAAILGLYFIVDRRSGSV